MTNCLLALVELEGSVEVLVVQDVSSAEKKREIKTGSEFLLTMRETPSIENCWDCAMKDYYANKINFTKIHMAIPDLHSPHETT